jgi:hypothetical protein
LGHFIVDFKRKRRKQNDEYNSTIAIRDTDTANAFPATPGFRNEDAPESLRWVANA